MAWNIQSDKKQGLTTKATLPRRLLFKIEGEIKNFPDKKKLKEFVNNKRIFRQMLTGLL